MRKPLPVCVKDNNCRAVQVFFGDINSHVVIEVDGWARFTVRQARRVRNALDKHIAYLEAAKAKRK